MKWWFIWISGLRDESRQEGPIWIWEKNASNFYFLISSWVRITKENASNWTKGWISNEFLCNISHHRRETTHRIHVPDSLIMKEQSDCPYVFLIRNPSLLDWYIMLPLWNLVRQYSLLKCSLATFLAVREGNAPNKTTTTSTYIRD